MKEIIKDKDQRNATLKSLGIHLLITLLFLFFGLTYLDPPPEDGIAVAFGYDADGGGKQIDQVSREFQSTPQEQASQSQPQELATEYTQNTVDAPAVSAPKPKPKPEETKETKETKPAETTPTETKPKVDDRLRNVLSNPNPNQTGSGSGTTTGDGVQGSEDGQGDRGGSVGGGGVGSSGNYRLGGRQALFKPEPPYKCQEEGRVVVRIRVDKSGKVISAEPGINLSDVTTNTSSACLFEEARQAALKTTWQSDSKAPELQTGYIIYNYQKN